MRYELKKPFAVLVKISENPEKENWCTQTETNQAQFLLQLIYSIELRGIELAKYRNMIKKISY